MEKSLEIRIADAEEHMRDTIANHCMNGRCDEAKRTIYGYRELINIMREELKKVRLELEQLELLQEQD